MWPVKSGIMWCRTTARHAGVFINDSSQVAHLVSIMDQCPSEIWTMIFSFACTDNGLTGRSLSLVSRYTNETSKPVKLQSLSLTGPNQISAFTILLETTPPELRRVRYLSIISHGRASHTRAPRDLKRSSKPASFPGEHYGLSSQERLVNDLPRIFDLLAPTLQVLHISVPLGSPSRLLPSSLPAIVELHLLSNDLRGQYLDTRSLSASPQHFPTLRRLRLGQLCHFNDIFGRIATLAPSLTHLRFCLPEHTYLCRDLELALGLVEPHPVADKGRTTEKLPPSIQRVSVQMGPAPRTRKSQNWAAVYKLTLAQLERMAKQDRRITLLRP